MQILQREQAAIDQYFKALINSGATFYDVSERLEVLMKLCGTLKEAAQTTEIFAECVEKVTLSQESALQQYFRTVAQEYYVFWMGDAVNIGLFNQRYQFNFAPTVESTQEKRIATNSDVQRDYLSTSRTQKAKASEAAYHLLHSHTSAIH